MDFLDPKAEQRNQVKLLLGYCLVALAIAGTALVLLYQAYGYQLNRQGRVTQNGLLFVSSQPSGSSIYMNSQLYKSQTNTRVTVPAGGYKMEIYRPGYWEWWRSVYVAGGDVQHFDYPFLFPKKLKTQTLPSSAAAPSLVTQSPDQRWLLMDRPDAPGSFTLYDLKNPKQTTATVINLPAGTITPSDGAQSWALEEWASDSRHVVLVHAYTNKGTTDHEYVLLDRDTPSDSVNLTYSLNLSQTEALSLFNTRVSQVYVYDSSNHTLQRINVSDGSLVSQLQHVLAYKTYASNKILYVTDQALNGKLTPQQVSVVLQDGQKSYSLRTLPAGASSYDLDLAQYSGDWYVAVAASGDSSVYVYKNPESEPTTSLDVYPAPWRRLDLADPSYISFSNNTQFLMAESGQSFVVYDLENVLQYHYTAKQPLDQPQLHATWMDGDRLMYVSGGKLLVFDYDYQNQRTLEPADPNYLAAFDPNYTYVYTLASSIKDTGDMALTDTALLTPADQ